MEHHPDGRLIADRRGRRNGRDLDIQRGATRLRDPGRIPRGRHGGAGRCRTLQHLNRDETGDAAEQRKRKQIAWTHRPRGGQRFATTRARDDVPTGPAGNVYSSFTVSRSAMDSPRTRTLGAMTLEGSLV